ncbi:Folate-biopterin transporter [Seminavis robusta]|uniref:Folate-biopterin transporter n=1 Tax=Seminavis robusta TaxID=568900 RepID=A0A9N8HWL4_9STRA|nr:Folate-biopterin transporter [Seminavis robusta]|eukprot:Sro1997_g310080.1 Folate-biopterin transporter (564) ;mRNA; f:2018-3709
MPVAVAKYAPVVAEEEEDAIELPPLNGTTTACSGDDEDDYHDKCDGGLFSDNNIHKSLLLYRRGNVAVPLNYFLVGMVQGFAYPLMNVYPLALGASEAQQTTLLTLKGLPSCFKILFGMLSDHVPLYGLRRKPYLYIGWSFSSLSLIPLLLCSDLTLLSNTNDDQDLVDTTTNTTTTTTTSSASHWTVPANAPSMALLCACFFSWACGVWMADVMGDALVAERAKHEAVVHRGNTQALCYILRGLGFVLVAPLSSVLYSSYSNGAWIIVAATTVVPLFHVPAIIMLQEIPPTVLLPAHEQLQALWNTACSPAVWQPMGFIFLYLSCFVTNSAWKQFLETCLHFTPNQLNALMILVGIMAFGGIVLYKVVFYKTSWRTLYIISIAANGVFSALQLLLIYDKTFGLPPFVFALGDEAAKDFILGVQYLPMVTMMVHLVPAGIEGASYALFTTTWNVASSLADSISTMLLGIWDVSKETLAQGDWSGLVRLGILTTVLQTLPLVAVGLLPHSVDDLQQEQQRRTTDPNYYHRGAGMTYLLVVALALAWTIFVDVMNIVSPGWMGES